MVSRLSLSKDGPDFSRLVQGFWRLSEWNYTTKQTIEIIDLCLELGITTFDHADIYGSYVCESLFGEAWKDMNIPRESAQIVTKCGIKLISTQRPEHRIKSYDTSKEHILASVDHSLKALRTEYIDLLLIHRPNALMDADVVADAFSTLRHSGKARYFGVSNFVPSQFTLLQSRMDVPLVTNQLEYSALNMDTQDDGSIDLCQQLGIRPMAWSPLGGGELFANDSEKSQRVRDALKAVGDEVGGASLDQVAYAFILKHPAQFLPVLGTGKPERIQSAVGSIDISLTHEQWHSIWQASKGHEVP